MRQWLRDRLSWLRRKGLESSRLIVGSTGSGKSEGELTDLIRLAGARRHAIVLLDGHGPLAFRAAGHWAVRGHESRLLYEPLTATDRVLCWNMLPRSRAANQSVRLIEDGETREEVAQCFLAQRNLMTVNDRPWTKEWLDAAIDLCLSQSKEEPLTSLASAFMLGSREYDRLLHGSDRPDIIDKFRGMEALRRRNAVQYEMQTGASRRLVELACSSEIIRLRSRPGPLDWETVLRDKQLLVFDGGGIRTRELKRTFFLLVTMQVLQAIRRHFSEKQSPLPVILVLEEAGALGLVTPFVMAALQELRKAGLVLHLITQSAADFGDRDLFETILANTPWQCWYQTLSPADQELGARALTNASFNPFAVHFTRTRSQRDGYERIETVSHGETVGPEGHPTLWRDRRTGAVFQPRFSTSIEPHFKSPQFVEQEYRTKLATLRIGERLVRDREAVRVERVKPARAPLFRRFSDVDIQSVVERVRRTRAEYSTVNSSPPFVATPLGAAERLRKHVRQGGEPGDGPGTENPSTSPTA